MRSSESAQLKRSMPCCSCRQCTVALPAHGVSGQSDEAWELALAPTSGNKGVYSSH